MKIKKWNSSALLIALMMAMPQAEAKNNKCLDVFAAQDRSEVAPAGRGASRRPDTFRLDPRRVTVHKQPSQALRDPLIEEARNLAVYDDFKVLSDLTPRALMPESRARIEQQAIEIEKRSGRAAAVRFKVERLYQTTENELLSVDLPILRPRWTIRSEAHQSTFEHTEKMWSVLTRLTPRQTQSSLIPLPYPILIPGARFQEGYYWDSFFAFPSLLKTGREALVFGQINNFLFLIKNYGLVPNGTRDYYLTRSQPPLLSRMVRLYIEHERKKGPLSPAMLHWLKEEVYPLIKKDYEKFWMNPETRYDRVTGLNRHYDSSNTPRPERHSSDKEEQLGETYQDVRAEAESGKDFTAAYDGRAADHLSVMLNSILFGVERDLAWIAELTGNRSEVEGYVRASERRRQAMNRYLWDARDGVYRDYNFKTRTQSKVITADIFTALEFRIASNAQAAQILKHLPKLERNGGLMSSEAFSGKQWDAPYGWAPHHYFAINGLLNYGYKRDAVRLADKWVATVDRIYAKTGKIIEKIDAVTGDLPHETGDKYPTQDGFLWTNGVYLWALTDVLDVQLIDRMMSQSRGRMAPSAIGVQ